jgi:hypothetical protein
MKLTALCKVSLLQSFKKVDTIIYQPRRSDDCRGHNIQTYMYKNVKPEESLWNIQVSTAKLVELPRVCCRHLEVPQALL